MSADATGGLDLNSLGTLASDEPDADQLDTQAALGDGQPDADTDQTGDQDAQDTDTDGLPTDPAALRKMVQDLRAVRGRQADELGQYRAYFDGLQGQTAASDPGDRRGSPLQGPGTAAPASAPGQSSEYSQALAQASAEFRNLQAQGYSAEQAESVFHQRMAAANQAEMQRQMFGFVSTLQQQQQQFQAFESAFQEAHPELQDARAQRLFRLMLKDQQASGMHRNPVDAYEAAGKATVEYLTGLGYEAVEQHESAKKTARSVATPGGRGARPAGQPTMTPEQVNAFLAQSAAKARAKMEDRLKNPSRRA
jgi:hypothetical protein